MAASTSSGLELNFGLSPDIQGYLEELQKLEEEKFQQMQLRKESQRAKINDSLNRVQELFEHQSFQDIALPCNSAKTTEATVVSARNNKNEVKFTSSSTKEFSKDTIVEPPAMKIAPTEEIPLHACSRSSFEEIVEEQMKKLMTDNNKEEIQIPSVTSQVKRPFLKKGSGCQRFICRPISYPKKAVIKEQGNKETAVPPSKNLKSQPAVCKKTVANTASQNQTSKFVQFCLPNEKEEVPTTIVTSGSKPPTSLYVSDNCIQTNKEKSPLKAKTTELVQKEAKELTQYEVLEDFTNCASFTSDSSLIMDVLNAGDAKGGDTAPAKIIPPQISTQTAPKYENTMLNSDDPLTYDLVLLRQRKIELEKQLQNCDKELKGFKNNAISDLPRDVFNILSSSDDEDNSTIPHAAETVPLSANAVNKKEPSNSITTAKALLTEKMEEIQKEIEIYKTENVVLAKRNKHREDELKAIRKEKEDFQKFKQAELDKLNKEMAEKRNEIRREKQTFDRYQKLRSDLPGKKEREELNVAKQEIESMREELKKKTIKFNAETKRVRNLLAASEKKAEMCKKEIQELTDELNNRPISNKKQERPSLVELHPKPKQSYIHQRINKAEVDSEKESIEEEYASEFSPLKDNVFEKHTNLSEDSDETNLMHHVRFNLDPEVQRFSPESHSSSYKEIQHGDKVERIYNNGDRQIFFQSGSRKFISANGLYVKFEFYNGDTQEIFPDKRKVYTYSNGVVQRIHSDGHRIIEFPNGQVEKYYSGGSTEVTDPNGTVITQRSDGIEEIRTQDGTVKTIFPNGTMIIEFPCGDKEIRAADFLRREFANGAIKTVYQTGRSETRLPNGRFRVKDKDGNVLFDNIMTM